MNSDVKSTVDRVLREQLAEIGYEHADVVEDVDHDGDDILRIEITYKKVGERVDPAPTFSVTTKLRKALAEVGEYRFPHLKHVFPEDQELWSGEARRAR